MRTFHLSWLFAALSAAVQAENTQENSEPWGLQETVIVTANRSAEPWLNSAATVDALRVEQQLPGFRFDSAELLAGLPGVQADSRSNFAQDTRISLRGFGARSAFGVRGINMRVDDIPLTMPDGQSQTSSIALDTFDRVEVMRGPLATLYGNAAGGTILFHTSAPETSSVALLGAAGDARQRRYRLRGEWAGERASARVQVSQFSTDGFREHSSAERNQFTGQWFYRSQSGIEVVARVDISQDPDTEDPQGLTYEQWQEDPTQVHPVALIFDPRKTIQHRQASLSLKQRAEWGSWQWAGWAGEREIKQFLSFPGDGENDNGAVIDLMRDFAGSNLRFARQFGSLEWSLGAEFGQMRDRRKGFVNDRGEQGELKRSELGEVQNRDFYTGLTWTPNEHWRIQAGARYNHIDFKVSDYYVQGSNPDDSGALDYQEPSYGAGLSYGEGDWRLFASAGEGFETPTLTEMAYRNEGTGLNLDLRSARNRQVELGWRYSEATLEASLVGFAMRSRDELVVDSSEGGRTTYRNGADTERLGLEAQGQWALSEKLSGRLGATWLDAQYTAGPDDGNNLPGVAEQNLYAQLDWRVIPQWLTLSATARYRSKVATGDDNTEWAPDSLVWDIAAQSEKQFTQIKASAWVKVDNLLDEEYVGAVIVNQSRGRTLEPAPPRQLNIGMELTRTW
ncbi:TonB-dependent receptor domain-containing protein [Gilvimarinus sp. DA14]|uniref:TonB-dependent receptor family protein n=1 Tax=Gilvimarinus sp. DA14 TaxID=2956798 RepID=UPI0020B8C9F9|nr:TonB-dependent receptor [Gilvimarinus sp. DA14]UTF61076.1 TonB-dependent receptor [Gilvimarinus sp. DA14]